KPEYTGSEREVNRIGGVRIVALPALKALVSAGAIDALAPPSYDARPFCALRTIFRRTNSHQHEVDHTPKLAGSRDRGGGPAGNGGLHLRHPADARRSPP